MKKKIRKYSVKAIFSLSGEEATSWSFICGLSEAVARASHPLAACSATALAHSYPHTPPPPPPPPLCPVLGWEARGLRGAVLPGGSLGEAAVCRGLTWMRGTGRQGVSMPRAGCVCLLTPVSSGPRSGIGIWQVSSLSDGWKGGRETGRNRGFE